MKSGKDSIEVFVVGSPDSVRVDRASGEGRFTLVIELKVGKRNFSSLVQKAAPNETIAVYGVIFRVTDAKESGFTDEFGHKYAAKDTAAPEKGTVLKGMITISAEGDWVFQEQDKKQLWQRIQ